MRKPRKYNFDVVPVLLLTNISLLLLLPEKLAPSQYHKITWLYEKKVGLLLSFGSIGPPNPKYNGNLVDEPNSVFERSKSQQRQHCIQSWTMKVSL